MYRVDPLRLQVRLSPQELSAAAAVSCVVWDISRYCSPTGTTSRAAARPTAIQFLSFIVRSSCFYTVLFASPKDFGLEPVPVEQEHAPKRIIIAQEHAEQ